VTSVNVNVLDRSFQNRRRRSVKGRLVFVQLRIAGRGQVGGRVGGCAPAAAGATAAFGGNPQRLRRTPAAASGPAVAACSASGLPPSRRTPGGLAPPNGQSSQGGAVTRALLLAD
jgi:hypothetical protein